MNTVANRWGNVLLFLILVVVAVVFLSPFYFVLANSVKTYGEIVKDAGAFPAQFAWKNYTTAWRWVDFPRAFLNSLFVTSISLLLMMAVGSMAAWRMVRRPHPA
ncbi:MAG: carbohydrate ABC transporter permease, partial [Spirochaetota bacterium]